MPSIKRSTKHQLPRNFYEKIAWESQKTVCGVDEVGRGCLAGPLVTAAVIIPIGKKSPLIKDSKLLSEAQLHQAALWIEKHCHIGYGIVHHRTIDQHNIWQATLIAMQKAVINLIATCPQQMQPSAILVDAMPLTLHQSTHTLIPVHHFIKGEDRSISIAAASIVAKVKRDGMMRRLAQVFPGYGLEEHKGYGTAQHQTALEHKKACLIHRTTFLKKFTARLTPVQETQTSLW